MPAFDVPAVNSVSPTPAHDGETLIIKVWAPEIEHADTDYRITPVYVDQSTAPSSRLRVTAGSPATPSAPDDTVLGLPEGSAEYTFEVTVTLPAGVTAPTDLILHFSVVSSGKRRVRTSITVPIVP